MVTAEQRSAALKRQLRSLDDQSSREIEEQHKLQALLRDIQNEQTRQARVQVQAERELRCAAIAARRLELERLKQRIDAVSVERSRAEVRLDVSKTPVDERTWMSTICKRRSSTCDMSRTREDELQALCAEREALRHQSESLEAERAILDAKRGERDQIVKKSCGHLSERQSEQ